MQGKGILNTHDGTETVGDFSND